jgi:arylsulfatase
MLIILMGCNQSFNDSAPPNFIVIMVDDMGFSDISPYGGEIETPYLEELSQQSYFFTQFYNAGRCAPTRASLLTGLYPHKAGVGEMVTPENRPGYYGRLSEESVTTAEVLREAGYQTFMSGKWHVTHYDYSGDTTVLHKETWPLQRGFDRFFGTISGAGSYYTPKSLMSGNTFITPADSFYYTTAITDTAIAFLEDADSNTPFFLYMAHVAPHWPLHAPEDLIDKYVTRYTAGWDEVRKARLDKQLALGIFETTINYNQLPALENKWEDEEFKEWQIYRMAVYAAQLELVDQGIGKLITKLKELNLFDNTMIIFLSDNGGSPEIINGVDTRHCYFENGGTRTDVLPGQPDTYASYGPTWATVSNTPYRLFKSYSHEGGIISPLLIHWPREIKEASIVRTPAHVIDIMPTLVAAAGARYPSEYKNRVVAPFQGQSLFSESRSRALFWEHLGNKAVRKGDWKLVAKNGEPWELYQITEDPVERNDIAYLYPEKVNELSDMWREWADQNYVDYDL